MGLTTRKQESTEDNEASEEHGHRRGKSRFKEIQTTEMNIQ